MTRPAIMWRHSWLHRGLGAALALLVLHASACVAGAEPIGPLGRRLAAVLDSMDVEHRWLPGDAVDWRTGAHDATARALGGHCSAFAAAACAAFGVYLLRPPDHAERLLANAQCEWLEAEGPRRGWTRIEDGVVAQALANQGNLVVACYRNREKDDPGHIAVIRPSAKRPKRIETEGPDVTQAGSRNYARTSARIGFGFHARAWTRGEIIYYWHRLPSRARLYSGPMGDQR